MLTVKTGTSFSAEIIRRDAEGNTLDLRGYMVRSGVLTSRGRFDLNVDTSELIEGKFRVTATGDMTRQWPCEIISWDIFLIHGDQITPIPEKENIRIRVIRGASA